jgi:hypothetical protein
MEKFAKCTVQTGCLYSGSAHLGLSARGRARGGFLPCQQNPIGRRPVVGDGVGKEQAGGVVDQIGGRREGRGSPEGFSMAEGIGGGERSAASRSRGHRRGPSSWRGSTLWRGAWGGVEMVGGGLEWAIRGGSATVSTAVFGVAHER